MTFASQHAAAADPRLEGIFHALGDPTRRRILEMLSERPHSVSALAVPLGITLTAVTQHLRLLEASGLVHTEKRGRVRTCRLEPAGFAPLEAWLQARRAPWQERLDRLSRLLTDPQPE